MQNDSTLESTTESTTAVAVSAASAPLVTASAPAVNVNPDATLVKLDSPLQRANGNHINEVLVLKPVAGALRNMSLAQLLQMDTASLHTMLPRITQPQITKPDLANLDPADLVALGTALVAFLVPKSQRADFLPE